MIYTYGRTKMQIPTNPMYAINERGVVRLISTGETIPEYRNHKGKRAVKIRGKSHKPSSHALDRLMLNTYKPPEEGVKHEWLSVKYLNENENDISITNLEWDHTWYHPQVIPGVNVPKDTWITSPDYPKIDFKIIGKNVLFRDSSYWTDLIPYAGDDGYLVVQIPGIRAAVKVHRIVALTLIPHPIDTTQLVVNHKDSNVTNNSVSNLEWTTQSENNSHAYREGPRGKTIRKIRLKNIVTNEEMVVSGFHEMSRYMEIYPQAAHQLLERRVSEGKPFKDYLFKYDDDPRSWEELSTSKQRKNKRRPDAVAVKDMYTGAVSVYTNLRDLVKVEKIRDFILFRLLDSDTVLPWRGRCFQRYDPFEKLIWPNYPKEILDVFSKTNVSDRPIKVTETDGRVVFYPSVTSWCLEDRENRCDPAVLCRYMKKVIGPCQWRDWVFEHIDLKEYSAK
jgi:hypothetical protein